MIHRESQQLFIGPYAIGANGPVRVIPYEKMFGRPTGLARHLTDPANKIVFATMEEGIYEVDVRSLAVQELWADEQRESGRKADLGRAINVESMVNDTLVMNQFNTNAVCGCHYG